MAVVELLYIGMITAFV